MRADAVSQPSIRKGKKCNATFLLSERITWLKNSTATTPDVEGNVRENSALFYRGPLGALFLVLFIMLLTTA